MCSRKNKREIVFAKRRISTAQYSLVAVIGCLQGSFPRQRNKQNKTRAAKTAKEKHKGKASASRVL